MVKDGAFNHKIDQAFKKNDLNLEGHNNCITDSRVTAILMNGWILPISGASAVKGLRSTGLPRLDQEDKSKIPYLTLSSGQSAFCTGSILVQDIIAVHRQYGSVQIVGQCTNYITVYRQYLCTNKLPLHTKCTDVYRYLCLHSMAPFTYLKMGLLLKISVLEFSAFQCTHDLRPKLKKS